MHKGADTPYLVGLARDRLCLCERGLDPVKLDQRRHLLAEKHLALGRGHAQLGQAHPVAHFCSGWLAGWWVLVKEERKKVHRPGWHTVSAQ